MPSPSLLLLPVLLLLGYSRAVSGGGPPGIRRPDLPFFDYEESKNVTALLGKTAILNCRVKNIGNKTGPRFDTRARRRGYSDTSSDSPPWSRRF
ncbi:hypothetical protein O3P69_009629 [Scylla paramamosain]|uniref:Uncharacterized protein n=1 Tax=Scylla paramamosain TaxID=85552 RepID=A0AAW0SWD4_SCYPA